MKSKKKWVIFPVVIALAGLFLYYQPEMPDIQERLNSFSEHKTVDKYDTKEGITYERLKAEQEARDTGKETESISKTQRTFNRLDIKDRVEQANNLIRKNWCANSCEVLNMTLKSYKTACNCK